VNGQHTTVACAAWCVTDHVVENERHLEDVAHKGSVTDLVVPGGGPALNLLAQARLGAFADGEPFVVIGDDADPLYELSAEQAELFAFRLEAFARQVRAMAAQLP
jgi:hypothetical protein